MSLRSVMRGRLNAFKPTWRIKKHPDNDATTKKLGSANEETMKNSYMNAHNGNYTHDINKKENEEIIDLHGNDESGIFENNLVQKRINMFEKKVVI